MAGVGGGSAQRRLQGSTCQRPTLPLDISFWCRANTPVAASRRSFKSATFDRCVWGMRAG